MADKTTAPNGIEGINEGGEGEEEESTYSINL
jgi:hypothetical protein